MRTACTVSEMDVRPPTALELLCEQIPPHLGLIGLMCKGEPKDFTESNWTSSSQTLRYSMQRSTYFRLWYKTRITYLHIVLWAGLVYACHFVRTHLWPLCPRSHFGSREPKCLNSDTERISVLQERISLSEVNLQSSSFSSDHRVNLARYVCRRCCALMARG